MFSNSISADLNRYSASQGEMSYLKAVIFHPGARFMYVYRKCKKYKVESLKGIFYRIWLFFLTRKSAVEIPNSCSIGEGLYMGHFKAIIINQNARIGKNCNISQGVIIGSESGKKNW